MPPSTFKMKVHGLVKLPILIQSMHLGRPVSHFLWAHLYREAYQYIHTYIHHSAWTLTARAGRTAKTLYHNVLILQLRKSEFRKSCLCPRQQVGLLLKTELDWGLLSYALRLCYTPSVQTHPYVHILAQRSFV